MASPTHPPGTEPTGVPHVPRASGTLPPPRTPGPPRTPRAPTLPHVSRVLGPVPARGRGGALGARADRGAVTVEAAIALGSLGLVTALAVGAVAAVGASVRCTDAARELARLAARGEPDRGRAVAAQLAPSGSRIALTLRGDEAIAEVTAIPMQALPVAVSGRAVAVLEPDVASSAETSAPRGADPPDASHPGGNDPPHASHPGGAEPADTSRPGGADPADASGPGGPDP
jgi:hypothetical protein